MEIRMINLRMSKYYILFLVIYLKKKVVKVSLSKYSGQKLLIILILPHFANQGCNLTKDNQNMILTIIDQFEIV